MGIRSWMVPGNIRASRQQHKSKETIRIQPDPISQGLVESTNPLRLVQVRLFSLASKTNLTMKTPIFPAIQRRSNYAKLNERYTFFEASSRCIIIVK